MVSLKKLIRKIRACVRRTARAGAKFTAMKLLFPAVYRLSALRPVDPARVVFVEVRIKEISDNYALIYDALKCGYTFDLRVHFLEELMVPVSVTYRRSIRALRDIARAGYVFVNDATNMVNAVKIRPETKVIQVWHACGPFKMFGYSVADLKFGATRRQMELYPIHRNYTHLIVGGTASVAPYAEAMGMEDRTENIYPIGVSRTDVFFDENFRAAAHEKFRRLMPSAGERRVILYAPTFRGRVASASTPAILRPEMLMEELGDEYVLVMNHHPFVKKRPRIPDSCRDFAMDMTKFMSIEELLCVADVCVTDYSSLVFEYSLFRRPMIFFAYDLADYYDWRGFYYKYEDFVCGPIVRTNLELISCLKDIENYDLSRVDAFRERFMTSCDGHATRRLLSLVFGDGVLAAARREVPLEGEFHTVPRAPRRRDERLTAPLHDFFFDSHLPSIYRRASRAKPGGAVYIQYRGALEREEIKYFRRKLTELMPELNFKTFLLARDTGGGSAYLRRCRSAVRAAATAGLLVTCEDMPALRSLKLRPETVHLRLPDTLYPAASFGKTDLAYTGGYLPDADTTYENISLAPAPSSHLSAFFSEVYGSLCPAVGAPEADMLRDTEYRAAARARLYEIFPASQGKNILLFAPAARGSAGRLKSPPLPDVQLMLEYLSHEWVLVSAAAPGCNKYKKLPLYYNEFYRDMTGALPFTVLIAAADAVVTDFRAGALAASAAGIPIFPFAADYIVSAPAAPLFPGWEKLLAAPFAGDTASLIKNVRRSGAERTDPDLFFDCPDGCENIAALIRASLERRSAGL